MIIVQTEFQPQELSICATFIFHGEPGNLVRQVSLGHSPIWALLNAGWLLVKIYQQGPFLNGPVMFRPDSKYSFQDNYVV